MSEASAVRRAAVRIGVAINVAHLVREKINTGAYGNGVNIQSVIDVLTLPQDFLQNYVLVGHPELLPSDEVTAGLCSVLHGRTAAELEVTESDLVAGAYADRFGVSPLRQAPAAPTLGAQADALLKKCFQEAGVDPNTLRPDLMQKAVAVSTGLSCMLSIAVKCDCDPMPYAEVMQDQMGAMLKLLMAEPNPVELLRAAFALPEDAEPWVFQLAKALREVQAADDSPAGQDEQPAGEAKP